MWRSFVAASFVLVVLTMWLGARSVVLAQAAGKNVVGVNIGDRLGSFDQAAKLVGAGGWVEILVTPAMCTDLVDELTTHPEVNLVLRLYNGGQAFSPEDAVPWMATLGELVSKTPGRKVYVLPWNEANLEGEGGGVGATETIRGFVNGLKSAREAGGLSGAIGILSPTFSFSNPDTVRAMTTRLGADFFNSLDGVALNIYDRGLVTSANPMENPTRYGELLASYYPGVSKPVFFTETGVIVGNSIKYLDGELAAYVSKVTPMLSGDPGVKMYAIFSYDPTPDDPTSAQWDMLRSPKTTTAIAYEAKRTPTGGAESGFFDGGKFGQWLTTVLGSGTVSCGTGCGWASKDDKCRPVGGNRIYAIADPASAVCPVDDAPPGAPDNYPFPSERPSSVYRSAGKAGGGIGADPSCLTGTNQQCFDKICGSGNSDGCDDVRVETKAWCSPDQCSANSLGHRCGICVSGSNIILSYQGEGCPEGFEQDNGCKFKATYGDKLPPLLPGTYLLETYGCYPAQTVEVKQGCTISGSLSCDGGGGSLRGDVDCSKSAKRQGPPPTPPPKADKGTNLENGVPVQGRWCAVERSTPIHLIEHVGYEPTEDFCLSAWWKGNIQLMPRSVTIPFAQDLGQYLVGIVDHEHFTADEINLLYDKVLGYDVPLLGRLSGTAKGASATWSMSGPVNRLMPQLEQDKLKHEFLGWLCEPNGDRTQGRIVKDLNTRYTKWFVEAPLLGSQILPDIVLSKCKSFPLPPGLPENTCSILASFLRGNPIQSKPCDIYQGTKWPSIGVFGINVGLFPVGDIYAKKMAAQCKTTSGTKIPGCVLGTTYRPNFIEQSIWDRLPLFANEESKGEVDMQLCGAQDQDAVKIYTAVPQVFRVSSASASLQRAMLPSPISGRTQAALAPIATTNSIKDVQKVSVVRRMWNQLWLEASEKFGPPFENFLAETENKIFQKEIGMTVGILNSLPTQIREPILALSASQITGVGVSLAPGQVLAAAACEVKPNSDCAAQFKCTKCKDAQSGPPDTEVFVGYKECLGTACGYKSYDDPTRGDARFVGTRTFTNRCYPNWEETAGCWKWEYVKDKFGKVIDQYKVPVRQEDDYDRYVGINNKVPFLLSIWHQLAAAPDGVLNILKPYRTPGKVVGGGLFNPSGKPFTSENTFLDTVGASSAQYKTREDFNDMGDQYGHIKSPGGVTMVKEAWKLLYYKLGGVWNAKNWVNQAVAP